MKMVGIFCLLLLVGCQAPLFKMQKDKPQKGVIAVEKTECSHQWKNLGVCFTYSGLEQPRVNEEAKVQIVIPDESQAQKLHSLRLKAYLWMPEHGHGSAPLRIEVVNPGVIFLHNLWFVMPGLWNLHLQWTNQDEQVVAEYVVAIEL